MLSINQQLHRYGPALLVSAVPALLPFSRLVEGPLLLMALLGIRQAWLQRAELLHRPGCRLILALFACFWLPAMLASLDATNPAKSWGTTAGLVRFLPAGLWVALVVDRAQLRWILRAVAALVLLWAGDALIQAAVGFNLLGMPRSDERLNGIFGATNIKLGPVLAVLSPFPLELARRSGRSGLLAAAFFLLTAAIVLIGTRSAWITYALVLCCYGMLYVRAGGSWGRTLAVMLAFVAAFGVLSYQSSDALRDRIDRSLLVLEGDTAALDMALSMRLPIWAAALRMGSDHWINGVGVRGFRYAYPDYAHAGDPWLDPAAGTGAYHAHQLVLEIWTETGLLGLLAWLTGLLLAGRAWWRTGAAGRRRALPFVVALAAMQFPLNTHLAFYSTFWSIVFWWLVMLFAAGLASRPQKTAEADA